MSGNRFLLDTNAIIALLKGNKNVASIIADAEWIGVSVISIIEFLSFSNLTMDDFDLLALFVEQAEVVDLEMKNFGLQLEVSHIRINSKLKLPDAIVATSALSQNAILITADKDYKNVANLQISNF